MKYIVIIFCAALILLAVIIAGKLIYRRIHHKNCNGGCLHCPFAQSCASYKNSDEKTIEEFKKNLDRSQNMC